MALDPSTSIPNLAARLRQTRVDLRRDLEISRHLFRGAPSYVVRDPVTGQSHCFSLADYRVLVSLDSSRPLGNIFETLVRSGDLLDTQEDRFYEFILFLHRASFLNLPITDGRSLYRRYKARRSAKQRARVFSFVYLDIPFWNPDAFLGRTLRFARPLFSRWFFLAWLMLVVGAVCTGFSRRHELLDPLSGLLAAQNLVIMWFTLVGLKLIHELGHAYACKYYGLHVPTLGVYLVAGVPCAYVDASASWSLTDRRKRIVICLAGMYFETIVSSMAMFVWAMTPPGLLNATAFNVIFLASAATVVFNINPLMRYDGYFVLCDLCEIANLGQRANEYVAATLKKWLLGIPRQEPIQERRLRLILLTYGLLAPCYRVLVLIAITTVLASRFFMVGLILGVLYLGYMLARLLKQLTDYLWRAQETAPVRRRAVALSVAAMVGAPCLAAAIPVRLAVQTSGVVFAGKETVVRAETPGFVVAVNAQSGQAVTTGVRLVQFSNDSVAEQLAEAQARLAAAEVRRDAYRFSEPAKAIEEQQRVAAYRQEVQRRTQQAEALEVYAPADGHLVTCLRPTDVGCHIPAGGEIATIVSGAAEVRALVSEDDVFAVRPRVGQAVECRVASESDRTITGVIERVSAAGDRRIELPTLTHVAGGDIAVSADSGEAMQPYFLLVVRLAHDDTLALRHGMTATICLPARRESIGIHLYRRVSRFITTIRKA
ncbi:MAG TPA: HlyD family efflux transporter periplasmic adaptor subunit [Phycisphaerae bacterium]|nr:HlyD family efflux transporter periplasmic adaptor subunit [Phycisphaerae bacterium]HRY70846.1 HlyD family efflux transporter periplasmic adaptor subunit [Phycisphaerae bacterium]HSA28553.1 HlyD family efflux transporter periplasmic adaptor subunit [Phycisphaerae bacterium]